MAGIDDCSVPALLRLHWRAGSNWGVCHPFVKSVALPMRSNLAAVDLGCGAATNDLRRQASTHLRGRYPGYKQAVPLLERRQPQVREDLKGGDHL